jgi:hypothetical protein
MSRNNVVSFRDDLDPKLKARGKRPSPSAGAAEAAAEFNDAIERELAANDTAAQPPTFTEPLKNNDLRDEPSARGLSARLNGMAEALSPVSKAP